MDVLGFVTYGTSFFSENFEHTKILNTKKYQNLHKKRSEKFVGQ